MKEAVIVSTARTPFARSWKGSFNMTHGATLAGHAVRHAVARAGACDTLVEDVIMGCAAPEGATGGNIGRQSAIRAGLPVAAAGMTVNRFCASGLQAVALAAQRVMVGEAEVLVAGGAESISCVQNQMNMHMARDAWIEANKPELYLNMIETAECVARRYGIDRAACDAYGAGAQQKADRAAREGRFDAEIVPIEVTTASADRFGALSTQAVTASADEGIRPGTTEDSISGLPAVLRDGTVTAGNASQFSDGASACVVMARDKAEDLGLTPLGIFRGFAVAGCEPDEMGIGPVFAVPKLLHQAGLSVSDIDLWELNEAFAVQVIHCRDHLGIPDECLNVNGGAIAFGHPYGASGSRMIGHALIETRRRGGRFAVATMCIGGGQGAAALLETFPT
ncbi:acetyl-CoA C-acyltransferase [Epibacterium sp. Ofav1-8]|uniref:acetyl-CoA C-acyltransferase n=1 Tax=Epibacterium sp. Ofav1-8 TaxID=2917735 RepID=UPI001EF4AA20|nr:acetyl-CoA C-acyltransferase [Epibacterium sp. Ofav1-8]MCG7625147.1 acetyl-CoA C-acyltransferase [Epibacterium sp. Ofav1-8]